MCIRDRSDRVTVAVVVQPRSENFLTEIHNNYKVIGSLYRCLYETFSTVSQFYVTFFCVYIHVQVVGYPVHLFYNASDKNRRNGIFVTVASFAYNIMMLVTCQSIDCDFQRLQCMINSFYHKKSLANLQAITKRLIYEYAHRDRKVDCGFFDLDLTLLPIAYDFMSLLFVTLLGTPIEAEDV